MEQNTVPTIFVQIASYRDAQLLPTIRDCVTKAYCPANLRFGLCWQRDDTETLAEFSEDERFRIIGVNYADSPGVGWARQQTQSLYAGEDFTLQIDSHHRFIAGWDEALVGMALATRSPKPILTCYAPAFNPFDPEDSFGQVPWALRFDRFTPEGVLLVKPEAIDDWRERESPLPARFFSAHFAFTIGRLCEEVPYDPNYYFHGEEINMAVRAFTHGYDLFYPHRVVLWHEYTRQYRPKHWDDHVAEKGAAIPWTVRNDATLHRNRVLFGMEAGEIDFGPFGFGKSRSLDEYERYAGINFRLRLIQPYTYVNKPPPNPEVYATDAEWKARALKDFWTCIRIPDGAIERDADHDFWYVGVHDSYGIEIDRRDLGADEIATVLTRNRYDFIHTYRHYEAARSWTVWPHSRTRGWLKKITRPIEV
jgi:hypothetical protein